MDAVASLRSRVGRLGRVGRRVVVRARVRGTHEVRTRWRRMRAARCGGVVAAEVQRVRILDGRTVDLIVQLDHPSGDGRAVPSIGLLASARPWGPGFMRRPPIQATGWPVRDLDGPWRWQVLLPLHSVLASEDPARLPSRLRVDLTVREIDRDQMRRPVEFGVLDGAALTPNEQFVEPIPPLAAAGVQLRLDTTCGLEVQVRRLAPIVEIAAVEVSRGAVDLAVVGSPRSGVLARQLWVMARAETEMTGSRVELVRRRDGWWRLDPAALLGALDSPNRPSEVVFDVWAAWSVSGSRNGRSVERVGRLGRRRSDLRDLRAAVELPSMWLGADGRAVADESAAAAKVVPYYATSRHLSVRIRRNPASGVAS